jgi:putative endonuclease
MTIPRSTKNSYFFYLFRCADDSLYSGITNNLEKRQKSHNQGTGSKYVSAHGGGKIVYWEKHKTKSLALKKEAAVKKLTKIEKENILLKNKPAANIKIPPY